VAALADIEPGVSTDLGRRLLALVRKELLRPDRAELTAGDAFRFRHVLIRDAAYDALPKATRANLHERFATWLERVAGDRAAELEEVIGYHLAEAARYLEEIGGPGRSVSALGDRAGVHLAAAGRRALFTGDQRAAIGLLERSSKLLSEPSRHRSPVLLDLCSAYSISGQWDMAASALDAAGRAITDGTSLAARSRFQLRMAFNKFTGPDTSIVELRRVAEEVIAAGEAAGDDEVVSLGLGQVGETYGWTGRMARERTLVERALELDRRGGRHAVVARELGTIANRLPVGPWPVAQAIPVAEAMLPETRGAPNERATVLLGLGMLELLDGQAEAGRARFAEVKRIADEIGLLIPLGAADWPMCTGMAELVAGDPALVVDALRWGAGVLERVGDYGHLASVAPLLAQVLLTLGVRDDSEIDRLIALTRRVASPDDFDAQARLRLAGSVHLSNQRRHEEALTLLEETRAMLAETDLFLLRFETETSAVRVAIASGDTSGASRARAAALEVATAKGSRILVERALSL
jgi:hypothetical protein